MKRRRRPQLEQLESRLCLVAPPLYPGTPFQLAQTGPFRTSPFVASPIFADLNNDRRDELIVAASGGRLIAYESNGQGGIRVFRTYETGADTTTGANIKATPIVVNRGDGRMLIFAALGRDESIEGSPTPNDLEDGRLFGWDALTGSVLPGWPQDTGRNAINFDRRGVTGPLASGDLDGDNVPEVIVTSFSTFVTAYRLDGSMLWRYLNDETVEPGSVIADLDRDGRNEVVFTSGISAASVPSEDINFQAGGFITILNGNDGTARRRIYVGEVFFASPVVADLNADGFLDIIASPGPFFGERGVPGARAAGNRVYAFDFQGRLLPGWPYRTTTNDQLDRSTFASPAVADLNGDFSLEVIHVDRSGLVHVIQANGQPLPGWEGGRSILPPGAPAQFEPFGTPIVVDVDGDTRPDIVSGQGAFLTGFDRFGNQMFSHVTGVIPPGVFPEGFNGAAAVGQFDGVGGLEMAAVSLLAAPNQPGRPSQVTMFQLPPSNSTPPWPMMRRSAAGVAVQQSLPFLADYVRGLFRAFFGRTPTGIELGTFAHGIQQNRVSMGLLTRVLAGQPEPRGRAVDELFRRYLNRLPNAGERAFRVAQLATLRVRDLAHAFVNSNEFFQRGGTVPGILRLLHETILGRPATQAEFDEAVRKLFAGIPLATISAQLLDSEEAILQRASALYAAAFGSPTIPPDSAAAIVFALRRGQREEDAYAAIIASGGNFASTQTLPSLVRSYYRDLLGREASPGEVGHIVRLFDAGSIGIDGLAGFLLGSPEGRDLFVREQFRKFLGREADPGALAALRNFGRREDLIRIVVASDEFFARSGGTVEGYVRAAYRLIAGIDPVPAGDVASWVQRINSGTPRAVLASTLLGSTPYINTTVVALLFRYAPDESRGVLRSAPLPLTAPGQPINPDPGSVAAFSNALLFGARIEDVIVALVTSPRYINSAAYFKGFYRNRGVRS